MRLICRAVLLMVLLECALAPRARADVAPPVLVIEAPPSLSSQADRIRGYDPSRLTDIMRLVGVAQAGPPIRIVLAPEGSPAALAAPSWATGYADGARGEVVLIPSRSFSYPYGSLEALVHHEVAHVLIARAAGGRPVPRWFNEGLAMAAARAWDVEDRTRLVIELIPGGRDPFSSVDDLFQRGRGGANRAYALSGAFVRDLLEQYGETFPSKVLGLLAGGTSFEDAFLQVTGMSLPAAETDFYRRQNIWNRWVPYLTSAFTLWTGISLLALLAIKRRRAKDARVKAQWEQEEAVPEIPQNGGA